MPRPKPSSVTAMVTWNVSSSCGSLTVMDTLAGELPPLLTVIQCSAVPVLREASGSIAAWSSTLVRRT